MDNPAEVTDLEAVWPFPHSVPTNAQARLDQAWRALQAEVSGIPARVAAGTLDVAVVVDVLTAAVTRVLHNPEGYAKGSTTIDDRTKSWELAEQATSGDLFFTAAERRRVSASSVATGAFTIKPTGVPPCSWE